MKHSQLIALSRSKEKKLPVINEEEEKKRIDESFETWLSQKRVQRKQEEEVGRKKTEEVEQVARKVDSEIASAAYKKLVNLHIIIRGDHCFSLSARWLHQKNKEAKEAAIHKEKCRRMFFKEAKELKV